jgi:TatD DNase family protein
MTDTHTHLYDKIFVENDCKSIKNAINAGVNTMLMPNIDSTSIAGMLDIEQKFEGNCWAMMGLHPCYVLPESIENELKIVENWLQKRAFCAIGEIGIDLHWRTDTLAIQQRAFETQLQWAIDYDVPVSIHCRKGFDIILETLGRYTQKSSKCRGVLHCFSGNVTQAQTLIGIGGVVTYKKSGLDDVLQHIDLQHIVLETDAPYLAPVPYRGQTNHSGYVLHVAQKLADIYQKSVGEIEAITTANARRIFGV